MRNAQNWKPSKVVFERSSFRPSSDIRAVSVASRLVASRQISHYQAAISMHASGRLLDLGCGFVPYYEMYKDIVGEVVCVDWENSLHKNEFVDLFMDLNGPLDLESRSFDTVILTDVLEHIYKPAFLLAEISRVLRPGGCVVIGVPFFYWVHESPFDFHRYTEFALQKMCADCGLRTYSLEAYGGAPEIIVDIVGKCIASAGLPLICRFYTSLFGQLLDFSLLRVLSRKTAKAFPLGYILVARKI